MTLLRHRRLRRLLPAVVAAATLAATIPAALPPDAGARPPAASGPPNRVALAERATTARWVP
jgi:peptidoglycan/LPS O-acetylase OafA/YrhL